MQAETPSAQGLEQVVGRYRVRSETSRERVREGERRRTAALEVRLWAVLQRGAATVPGDAAWRDAARALLRLAEAALAGDGRAPLGEVEPLRPALYESRQVPGCDELHASIRLPLRFAEDGVDDGEVEARLRTLRRRLDALGIFEGRWRPRPPPPDGAEPWTVRPVDQALGGPADPARRAA